MQVLSTRENCRCWGQPVLLTPAMRAVCFMQQVELKQTEDAEDAEKAKRRR